MFGTVIAVLILVVLVLPGFVASRVARGGKAAPASLGDLELALIALGYALVVQAALALTGWTGSLFKKIDSGTEWTGHVPEVVGWFVTVFALAFMAGLVLHFLFGRLAQGQELTGWKSLIFHGLGGQDVRDGFDYIFERRKRQDTDFIAVIETDGAQGLERHAGRYGELSYFGLSPQPHDLYLEEMWQFDAAGDLKTKTPAEGGWFSASSIRGIYFRDLPDTEKQQGATTRLGWSSFAQAVRDERRRNARLIAEAVPGYVKSSGGRQQIEVDYGSAIGRVLDGIRHADEPDLDTIEQYGRWSIARSELFEFGVIATVFARRDELDDRPEALGLLAELGRQRLRVDMKHTKLWLLAFELQARELETAPPNHRVWHFDELISLVVDGLFDIDNFEWDVVEDV